MSVEGGNVSANGTESPSLSKTTLLMQNRPPYVKSPALCRTALTICS